ncbi:cupin domain-containing protein [Microbacterium protaetiae]|uniref:Cupin domain-containing protein n=1 Tax=Microbacterium protaetiae TaxID=2509458 RepID=A0A4P6EGX4_9MICO|nr:quercetin 2,3-dioxygenase [Microbacterium protaetiae]QAY59347.1 cupin domain-containing protein [Microbacterium protaetiae]
MSLDEATSTTHPHAGILPGKPAPFFLAPGGGEKSVVFDTLFTVLLTGDETNGQYDVFTCDGNAGQIIPAHVHLDTNEIFFITNGAVHVWMDDENGFKRDEVLTPGGFGYVPQGVIHAFRIESADSRILGVSTAGFGRFFHEMGKATDKPGIPAPDEFFAPSIEQMMSAGQAHGTIFRPDYSFLDD